MKDREKTYPYYTEKLNPENDPPTILRYYEKWLLARNNKSWTNLQRLGKGALKQPERLHKLIKHLRDESTPIQDRVQNGLEGKYKVYYIGPAILTGLLHTFYPTKYCVWNGSTIKALKKLDINTPGLTSKQKGYTYQNINHLLLKMAKQNGTDLNYIDGFMWYVATKLPSNI